MPPDVSLLNMLFGISAAASWGAADFCGGLATRRSTLHGVLLWSQFIGALALMLVLGIVDEPLPSARPLILGALAGISGACGLMALYRGLALGKMGIVASLTAVVAACLPVGAAFFTQGRPPLVQVVGFGLALAAVWLLAAGRAQGPLIPRMLALPLLAGLGFGLYFICIARASANAFAWPLFAMRLSALTMLMIIGLIRKNMARPNLRQLPLIAAAGIGDVTGNIFYALATRFGRMDVATVLSSLYPAATVLLAWLVLKERLSGRQWIGLFCALTALALIARG
jgi:drug/metabolite transporter (DMT)-like permease